MTHFRVDLSDAAAMGHPFGVASLVSAVVVSLAACSGSTSTSSNCGNVSPCGGNIVGSWKIVSACSSSGATMPDQSCPSESISVNSDNTTGTFVFNADGTYQASLDASASETLTLPLSCLTLNGVTSCDQFGVDLSSSVQLLDGGPGPIADTCTTSGSTCRCSVTVTLNGLSATGTYTVSGTHVTTMPDGSNGTGGGDFCVQGNTLRLFGNAMVAAGMQGTAGMPPSVLLAERQ